MNFRLVVAAALLSSAPLYAADVSQSAQTAPDSAPTRLDASTGVKKQPLWEVGLGAGGLSVPDYRGADQSQTRLFPVPFLVYRGTWLKADRDGTRALLINTDRVKLDVSLGASPPTRTGDNVARAGMPNLPGTFEMGPDLNITLAAQAQNRWKLELRLPVRAAVTLEQDPRFIGATFSPNLNLDLNDVGGGWRLGLLTGPLFADTKNHRFFYDVEPAYARAGRASYRAKGGYSGWRAVAATSRRFGDTWVGAFIRCDHLGGATFENSPLVRRTSSVSAGFAVTWVFAASSKLVAASD